MTQDLYARLEKNSGLKITKIWQQMLVNQQTMLVVFEGTDLSISKWFNRSYSVLAIVHDNVVIIVSEQAILEAGDGIEITTSFRSIRDMKGIKFHFKLRQENVVTYHILDFLDLSKTKAVLNKAAA